MEGAVAFLVAQGWASGLSAWAVLVITGVADRVGYIDAPGLLGSPWVLAGASVLLVVEFFADKVSYVDSVSDTAQTLVRPLVAAGVGAEWAQAGPHLNPWAGAALAGGVAVLSHGTKMGLRAAINASPEPVTNVVASSTEDAALAGVVAFSFHHPVAAASAAGALLILGVGLAAWLVWLVRRVARGGRGSPGHRMPGPQRPHAPPPARRCWPMTRTCR